MDPVPQGCRREHTRALTAGQVVPLSHGRLGLSDGSLCQKRRPGKVQGTGMQLCQALRWAVKSRRSKAA